MPWSFSSQDEGRERGGGGGEGRAVLLPLVRQGPCDLHQSQTVPVSGRRVGSGWALRVSTRLSAEGPRKELQSWKWRLPPPTPHIQGRRLEPCSHVCGRRALGSTCLSRGGCDAPFRQQTTHIPFLTAAPEHGPASD